MKYFQELDHLTIRYNLLDSLSPEIMNQLDISKQVCINAVPGYEDNLILGINSLIKDWDNITKSADNGIQKIHVGEKVDRFYEKDFTVLCNAFIGTPFEEIYHELKSNFDFLGRLRLFKSEPKTCLTWHTDHCRRLHYPIKTQDGCLMVIEDEVMHLKQNTWYETHTEKMHTAMNGSNESRIHLVAVI